MLRSRTMTIGGSSAMRSTMRELVGRAEQKRSVDPEHR